MTDKLRSFANKPQYHTSAVELVAELRRLAPFRDSIACCCGSRNRVWNTLRQTFCQKCGMEMKALVASVIFGYSLL